MDLQRELFAVNKMKKIIAWILSVAVIVLEALPFGVTMRFASPNPNEVLVSTHSYFSLLPYGYGDFGPLLTAVLSVALLVALSVYCYKNKGIIAIRIFAVLAVFTSVLPVIMLGFSQVNPVSACITGLLIAECVLFFKMEDKRA